LSELLIPTRKLRSFDRNPFGQLQQLTGGNKDTRDRSASFSIEKGGAVLYRDFVTIL
jgi:hypothetical protein